MKKIKLIIIISGFLVSAGLYCLAGKDSGAVLISNVASPEENGEASADKKEAGEGENSEQEAAPREGEDGNSTFAGSFEQTQNTSAKLSFESLKAELYEVKKESESLKAEVAGLREAVEILGGIKINVNTSDGSESAQENMQPVGLGEAGAGGLSGAETENGLININTAGKDELMELPGIGEAKAESIIGYREDYGGFSSIEEIMNISGIKEAAFAKLKDKITV